MAINTNNTQIGVLLESVFGVTASNPTHSINKMQFCHGDFPGSTSEVISTTNILTAGTAPNNYTLFTGSNWSVPSEGVTILASGVSGLIKSSGLPAGAAISFIRLLSNSGSVPIFDIPVDIAKGVDNAVLSKISGIVANEQVVLKDLRMKIVTKGGFSFNNALASAILRHIVGIPNTLLGYYGALMFGQGYVYETSSVTIASPLYMDIYDGATIPESANLEPTGTLLWKSTISTSSTSYLEVNGTCISSTRQLTANATATGTATYIRIIKNAITTGGTVYPKLTMQLKVGVNCFFNTPNMVTGQSNTLEYFNVLILS